MFKVASSALLKLIAGMNHPHLPVKFGSILYNLLPKKFRKFTYSIQYQISSSATKVLLSHKEYTAEQICLKMWLECNNGVYVTDDLLKRTNYLLEGLEFNRQFAPEVYLGIAPVLSENNREIRCGPIIEKPQIDKIMLDIEYVLVMNRLKEDWRLDHQLYLNSLSTNQGMDFLAQGIAEMHKKLAKSPKDRGTPASILAKLDFNSDQFAQSLLQLKSASEIKPADFQEYENISTTMHKEYERCSRYFKQRHESGHIKRCHGDLKAANLWVLPGSALKKPDKQLFSRAHTETISKDQAKRLFALDCVDFNPEFCHIDTLSDVAMLAIDIEMRLTYLADESVDGKGAKRLARRFLNTYLQHSKENGRSVWPLLEYYMTEKAMVCAYMSILYDGLPTLGKRYLDVALVHAHNLVRLLEGPSKSPSTHFQKKPPSHVVAHSG